ncbi:MAG: hypothetical protein PHW52_00550 [Candidatus Pacebacteria bacterium]|nr:hypothetical protein [Candidatus Paceibacterota bacterium]
MNLFEVAFKNKKLLIILFIFSFFPLLTFAADDILSQITSTITGGLNSVSGMGLDVAKAMIAGMMTMLAGVGLQLLQLGISFLSWTSSGDFLQSGMTSSMNNPMISEGWTVVRNIANILLIFGLVAVAISIMLEYQESKAKKMLINFVLMALLINFTPVICDTIIDVANSLMKIFLKGGVSPNLANEIQNRLDAHKIEDIVTVFVLCCFCLLAFFIYLLYGILFMFRYIQLWLLIIISPIAFASKVFLPTGMAKYMDHILPKQCQWDPWWADFLKWTFIGVPAAFTIYLSNILMKIVTENSTAITSAPGGALQGTFSLIFSYMIPFGVLIQGFIMTMDKGSSDMFNMGGFLKGQYSKGINRGSNAIKDGFTGGGKWIGRGVGGMFSRTMDSGSVSGVANKGAYILGGFGNEGRNDWKKKSTKLQESLGLKERGTYEKMIKKEANEKSSEYENLTKEERDKIENRTTVMEKIRGLGQDVMGTSKGTQAALARVKAKEKEMDIKDYKKVFDDIETYEKTDPELMKNIISNLTADTKEGKLKDDHYKILENSTYQKIIKKYDTDDVIMKNAAKYRPDLAPALTSKTIAETIKGMTPKEAGEKIEENSLGGSKRFEIFEALSKKQIEGIAKNSTDNKKDKIQEVIDNEIKTKINDLETKIKDLDNQMADLIDDIDDAKKNGNPALAAVLQASFDNLNTRRLLLIKEKKSYDEKVAAFINNL